MSQSEDQNPDIKIVDRRSFTSTGEKRNEDTVSAPQPEAPSEDSPQPTKLEGPGFTMEEKPLGSEQDPAFVNLCVSLFQSGCIHLGVVPEGGAEAPEIDLAAAKGIIEMLAMLKDKTNGNLSDEEQKILESLIAELQMAWVVKQPGS
jgi:hypothetical protein